MLDVRLYCCLSKFEYVDYLELQHEKPRVQRLRAQELKHGKLGVEKNEARMGLSFKENIRASKLTVSLVASRFSFCVVMLNDEDSSSSVDRRDQTSRQFA